MDLKPSFDLSNRSNIKQYFVVNGDLHMGKGKIASQVAHACGVITEEITRWLHCEWRLHPEQDDYTEKYQEWRFHMTKIVLVAPEKELRYLIGQYPNCCRYIVDAGLTQIPENSLTVIGFFPGAPVKDVLKDFKLL